MQIMIVHGRERIKKYKFHRKVYSDAKSDFRFESSVKFWYRLPFQYQKSIANKEKPDSHASVHGCMHGGENA